MNCQEIREQMRVRTVKVLGGTIGMLIKEPHLDARKPNTEGIVLGYVAGHGGDVWWVKHDDDSVGAYVFYEIEAI